MKPLKLCAERLERIRTVLSRVGGKASFRDLRRTWAIYDWEVVEACRLGWLFTYVRKPERRGRPSRVAVWCGNEDAIKPPSRKNIEPEISIRHQMFAMRSVLECVRGGSRVLGMPGRVSAYKSIYRSCASERAAGVSTARLLRRPDVRAVRQWYFAKINQRIPICEVQPRTVSEIRERLTLLSLS